MNTENFNTIKQLLKNGVSADNIRRANLSDANLRDANLRDANLRGADLRDANLRDANLRGADLSDANLSGADLSDADLSDANLSDADLSGADLSDADLSGADLSDADLSDANLRQSRGLKFCHFSFSGLGSESRQWLLVHIGGKWKFFCGCWSGSPIQLYHRIKQQNGREQKSRMFAFKTMIQAAKFSREEI